MAHIHIKNIGPIYDTGIINLTPVMVFIGKQSTGKSTLMKILCFCKWLEKRIMVGGKDVISNYTHYYRFLKELMRFHRIPNDAFNEKSFIQYNGDVVTIELKGKEVNAKITKCKDFDSKRYNTKLSFIPAERNLLSAISNIEKNYKTLELDMLFNYILEWNEVRESFTYESPLKMAFDINMDYFYDENIGDQIKLHNENKIIKTFFASSGVQSALPILGISKYLCSIVGTLGKRSPMDYLRAISNYLSAVEEPNVNYERSLGVSNFLRYKSAQMFIEEPEQNLFPMSQFELVKSVIACLKSANSYTPSTIPSGVVYTTHSPYIVTAINVLRLAAMAYEKDSLKVKEIIGEEVILPPDYYSAYSIENGFVENIIDVETGLIAGDYLDSISEIFDDFIYKFNAILYANANC